MRDFIISTDSTADLSKEFIRENNILIHPLYYIIDGKEYGMGKEELSIREFFKIMKEGKMPTTSGTNPEYITRLMKDKVDEGFDILHISFSGALSSSYNNAVVCSEFIMEDVPESNIKVIDSVSGACGEALLVYKAVQLKKEGKTIDEIVEWIEKNKYCVVIEFAVKDLFHLVRGGRISKTAAMVGSVLQVQPLLHLNNNGEIKPFGKVRGRKKALNTLVNNIGGNTKTKEINMVFISHSDCIEEARYVADKVKERYGVENIFINDICPTIGTHIGQGTVVISYLGDKR
ncbi:MAG: DegV family protein [Clostridium sp.]|nr:DegV family protein [Clostridium sp.]